MGRSRIQPGHTYYSWVMLWRPCPHQPLRHIAGMVTASDEESAMKHVAARVREKFAAEGKPPPPGDALVVTIEAKHKDMADYLAAQGYTVYPPDGS